MVVVGFALCTVLLQAAAVASLTLSPPFSEIPAVPTTTAPTTSPRTETSPDVPWTLFSDDTETPLRGSELSPVPTTKMPMASDTRSPALANFTEVTLMFKVGLSEFMPQLPAISSALEQLLLQTIPNTRSVHILWACEVNLWSYCYYASDLVNVRKAARLEADSATEHWSFGFDVDTDTADLAVKSSVSEAEEALEVAVGYDAVFMKVYTQGRTVEGDSGIGPGAIAAIVLVGFLCAGTVAALVYFARYSKRTASVAGSDCDSPSDVQEHGDGGGWSTAPDSTAISMREPDFDFSTVHNTSMRCSEPVSMAYCSQSQGELSEHPQGEVAAEDEEGTVPEPGTPSFPGA